MAKQPNVVVFLTDQQRWDSTGLHGNPLDLTPNLDRIARQGTHINTSITCQPVCGPARSCLQTGLYATETGVYKNDAMALGDAHPTLANYFAGAGYHTGYIGKWHLASKDPVIESERGGYQTWLAANTLEHTSEPYRFTVFNEEEEEVTFPGYRVDAQTDTAIRFISEHRDEPFFLFCSYLEPHHQNRTDDYPAPDGYRERYQGRWLPPDLAALGGSSHRHIAGYWGMIKRLDEAYGRMLDALKSLGLRDNTIILFTSDHGCHFKTRGQEREYKRSCQDASVRVPTVFTGPGFIGGGEVSSLVSLVDLPPTLLDAAGLEIPDHMQGSSIMPLLRGGQEARDAWRNEVFIQISESEIGRAIRTPRWKYAVTAIGLDGRSAPGADEYTETYLYDLEVDPYELDNLIGLESHRELSDHLKERLISRMIEAGEKAPLAIHNAEPRTMKFARLLPEEILM